MSLPIHYWREARAEFDKAYDWYESRQAERGVRFLTEVRKTLAIISASPKLYAIVYRDVRQVKVSRFRYSICYIAEADRIVVVSVFHTSRNPKVWKSRRRRRKFP